MIRIAISGFGRIGRSAFKVALDSHPNEVEVVAINDLTDIRTLAHLLKYDSSYGVYPKEISFDDQNLIVNGKKYRCFTEKDPVGLPWKNLGVDVVIEATGKFTSEEKSRVHLNAGARRVVISAPAEGVKTLLLGVNQDEYNGEQIVNNASCTTNCIAPVAAIMDAKFGVAKGMMTTIHAYTSDQNLQDGPHQDLRRARAAAENIVPTTTGAVAATTEALPNLKGLFGGMAIRVPVPVGSISDFTFVLKKKVTVEEVNNTFKEAVEKPLYRGIVAAIEEPIVSSDIVGRTESSIVDLSLTQVVDGDMVKVFAWYDNEMGYSHRLIEQVINIGKV